MIERTLKSSRQGLTLIELLSVVAIIAILIVAALPMFRDAAIRAKVSRVRGDLHTVSTALNIYAADHNAVPDTPELGTLPGQLSTPITYLTATIWPDPFYKVNPGESSSLQNQSYRYNRWQADPTELDKYSETMNQHFGAWTVYSNPPVSGRLQLLTADSNLTTLVPYDVTNGVNSAGRPSRSEKQIGS